MVSTITTTNIDISDVYEPLFDNTTDELVLVSGRTTGKTTHIEIAAITYMMQSTYNNIWYCRAEVGDIESTIFSSMLTTIDMMGLNKYFDNKKKPYKIICKKTGAVCYFTGINGKVESDITSTKGFTPRLKTLKMIILDEADQTKFSTHVTGWETTAGRFLLPTAKKVFAFNPPPNRAHWSHTFFAAKIRSGAKKIYATWLDIAQFLNERVIRDILKFKKDEPLFYRYWYLGEPVNFTGMVYPQFQRDTHVISVWNWMSEHYSDRPYELILGLDEGTVNDSTCVTPLLVMQSGIAIVLDCLEIDPLKIGQQAPTQNSKRLYDFTRSLIDRYPFLKNLPRKWIFECAEGGQMLKLQFEQDYGEVIYLVQNKSIMGDVKRVRNMLAEKILLFNVDGLGNTMTLIEDIENYVFDEKTGDIKKQQRDDTIDSLEYATKLYYNVPL